MVQDNLSIFCVLEIDLEDREGLSQRVFERGNAVLGISGRSAPAMCADERHGLAIALKQRDQFVGARRFDPMERAHVLRRRPIEWEAKRE